MGWLQKSSEGKLNHAILHLRRKEWNLSSLNVHELHSQTGEPHSWNIQLGKHVLAFLSKCPLMHARKKAECFMCRQANSMPPIHRIRLYQRKWHARGNEGFGDWPEIKKP